MLSSTGALESKVTRTPSLGSQKVELKESGCNLISWTVRTIPA